MVSLIGLTIVSPFLLIFLFLIWLQDRHSPLFIATRIGLHGKSFKMIKLRSMVINASGFGGTSTSNTDNRITPAGRWLRKFKIDELTQLYNVLKGDMSLVGPRPQVALAVKYYTEEEKKLLTVKPGITDFASIVFSDEGEILKDTIDPDIGYNQLIRPGKSRLGIFYAENSSLNIDIQLILLTLIGIISRQLALKWMSSLLTIKGADKELCQLSLREQPLLPLPPPGAQRIVTNKEGYVG